MCKIATSGSESSCSMFSSTHSFTLKKHRFILIIQACAQHTVRCDKLCHQVTQISENSIKNSCASTAWSKGSAIASLESVRKAIPSLIALENCNTHRTHDPQSGDHLLMTNSEVCFQGSGCSLNQSDLPSDHEPW